MKVCSLVLEAEILVYVEGFVDDAVAPLLHEHIDLALDRGVRSVVVDLARVPAIDDEGVGVLAAAAHRLSHVRGRLVLQLPGDRVALVHDASHVRAALGTSA